MLYLIGLGLGDAKDVTVKGLEVIRSAEKVFLEAYTSILTAGKEELEQFYGREVLLADRDLVEQDSDAMLSDAGDKDVAFLVVGDPLGATTHTDLIIRAKERGIQYRVIHNASILNAVGCCGLQLYNYGETVSICMWNDNWQPDSFMDKILANLKNGLHTLCLLDIKMKEQTVENMMRGRKIYEPPRFLSANDAIKQILQAVNTRKNNRIKSYAEHIRDSTTAMVTEDEDKQPATDEQVNATKSPKVDEDMINEDTLCVALARVGWNTQQIVSGKLSTVMGTDMGPPIHSLVIPGNMHYLERDMLKIFAVDENEFKDVEVHLL